MSKYKAEVSKISLKCTCGGIVSSTGIKLDVNPPMFEHQCNRCKNLYEYSREYPFAAFGEVEEISK